jgi:hypothetical protein
MYLDALAFKLFTFYVFKKKQQSGTTFGDVLNAIATGKNDTNPRWSYMIETATFERLDEGSLSNRSRCP